MAVFWFSRMISVMFVFLPVPTDFSLFSVILYLLATMNLCASWYSSYLVMELIAKYKFAGNLQDMAYFIGLGRTPIILISMVSAFSTALIPAF